MSSSGKIGMLSGGSTPKQATRLSRNDKTFFPSAVAVAEGSAQIGAKCRTTFESVPATVKVFASLGESV